MTDTTAHKLAALALAVALQGCRSGPPAALLVEVTTNVPTISWLELRVRSADGRTVLERRQTQWASRTAVSFHLVPRGSELARSPNAVFDVAGASCGPVNGEIPTSCIEVERRVIAPYQPGATHRINILLDSSCRTMMCAESTETCVDGECRPALLTPVQFDAGGACVPNCSPSNECQDDGCGRPCGCVAVGNVCTREDVCAPAQPSCPTPTARGCGRVRVPGGTESFNLGAENRGYFPEQPTRVTDFWLDSHEVTVARFRAFWDAAPPLTNVGDTVPYSRGGLTYASSWSVAEPSVAMPDCNWTPTPGANEEHPINCLDWATALAFCVWDGGRLPTEAEFEYAVRYRPVLRLQAGRAYAWGENYPFESDCGTVHFFPCMGDDGRGTRRVGSTQGVDGIFDLAGNVGEWTADIFDSYRGGRGCWPGTLQQDPLCTTGPEERTIRGGNYDDDPQWLQGVARAGLLSSIRVPQLGFRCARNSP